MATTAQQVDFLAAGIQHNGKPVSYGYVTTYLAGTSTPSALWVDSGKAVASSNPIVLDADGKATVYGDNEYKFVITDSNSAAIITFDNFTVKLVASNIAVKDGTLQTNLNADLLDSLNTGNASGNIPISNGVACTNLNAEKVNGLTTPQLARLDVANNLTGDQKITSSNTFIVKNNIAFTGYKADGVTPVAMIGMGPTDICQVGNTGVVLNLNSNGTTTVNGSALATPKGGVATTGTGGPHSGQFANVATGLATVTSAVLNESDSGYGVGVTAATVKLNYVWNGAAEVATPGSFIIYDADVVARDWYWIAV